MSAWNLNGHAYRVLLGLLRFVFLNVTNHLVLPVRGIYARFIGNLVEHIIQVIDHVDDLTNVGLL